MRDDDDQAEQIGLDRMSVEDLKKFNKNKNLIKKFAKKYDAFLASDSLIKQVSGVAHPPPPTPSGACSVIHVRRPL